MRLLAILGLVLSVCIFSGCGESTAKKKYTIGISVPAATHGWAGGVAWSAEQAKKQIEAENDDIEVIVTTAENTTIQVDRIENMLARGIDALVILSQEPGPITAACEIAKKQGVYLVIVSNPLSKPLQDYYVDGDNKSLGAAAAEAMGSALKGEGDIVVMEGIPCPINNDRVETFRKVLSEKYPKIKILESQSAYWNTEKGMNLMENYLQKYPKIDAVWAGDDDVLVGALKGYEESKRQDIKVMIGGGGSKVIVKKILDNDSVVKATVTYSHRMVELGAQKAVEGLRNGKAPVNGITETLVKSEIVTPENATKYYFPDSVY